MKTSKGPAVNTIIALIPGKDQKLGKGIVNTIPSWDFRKSSNHCSWLQTPQLKEQLGKVRRWGEILLAPRNWILEVKSHYHQVVYSTWHFLWPTVPPPTDWVTASGWGTSNTTAKQEKKSDFKLWFENCSYKTQMRHMFRRNKTSHALNQTHCSQARESVRCYYSREQAASRLWCEANCRIVKKILVDRITYKTLTSHN
jgi:hypothetical protein